jgi:uncharacterized membrane protein
MIVGEIRQEARRFLQGHWNTLVPIWFIFFIIVGGASGFLQWILPVIGTLATLIVGGPMCMGVTMIFLRIYRKEPFEMGQVLDGFKDFSRTFTAYLLIAIFTFLWMLLLIVPGIIAGLGYSMTFFIMAENPGISATDAMSKSKQMMMGYKWDLFRLGLSFIGWMILCVFTCGIGFLWLESYIFASITLFYKKIKGETQDNPVTAEEPIKIFKEEEKV